MRILLLVVLLIVALVAVFLAASDVSDEVQVFENDVSDDVTPTSALDGIGGQTSLLSDFPAAPDSEFSPDQLTENEPVQSSGIDVDYTPAKSMKEIFDRSNIAVRGRAVGIAGVVNTSMDPEDPSKPHAGGFGLGRIYDIEVDEYFKGDGEASVQFVQTEAFIYRDTDEYDPEALVDWPTTNGLNPVELDQEFVFFFRRWPSDHQYFVNAHEPNRYRLIDGMADPEGSIDDAADDLPVIEMSELITALQILRDRQLTGWSAIATSPLCALRSSPHQVRNPVQAS